MTAPDAQPASSYRFASGPTAASTVLAPAPGFVCLPRAVLRAPGLSVLARLLYATLVDYARGDGRCFPGMARLQTDLGCGHNQLARAVRELEAGGLVARRRRGYGKTMAYHILPLPAARPARRALPPRSLEALVGNLEDGSGPRRDVAPNHTVTQNHTVTPGNAGQCVAPEVGTHGPRSGSPERPAPAAQCAPVRVGQDSDSGDQDAADQQHQPPPTPEGEHVVALLVQQGITPGVAVALAARHDAEAIRHQVENHRHRVAASGLSRNPPGALVKAIREDWAPAPAWAVARAGAAVRAVQAAEERRRQEEEAARRREWAQKPPEERIAGRLQFWVMGRRVKGHEPGEAEIAARRAELLTELSAAAGGPRPATD